MTAWQHPLFRSIASGPPALVSAAILGRLEEVYPRTEANSAFVGHARSLIRAIAPALAWLRDRQGLVLDDRAIRLAVRFDWIGELARNGSLLVERSDDGTLTAVPVVDFPHEARTRMMEYLERLPGYDLELPHDRQSAIAQDGHRYFSLYILGTLRELEYDRHASPAGADLRLRMR